MKSMSNPMVPAQNHTPSIISHLFEGKDIRTATDDRDGSVSVCLTDLLRASGSSTETAPVVAQIEKTFGKGLVINLPLETTGGVQNLIFISEYAAAFVVSRGRTDEGRKLNRWLFMEVLPTIRRTGSYSLPQFSPQGQAAIADIKKRTEVDITPLFIGVTSAMEADKLLSTMAHPLGAMALSKFKLQAHHDGTTMAIALSYGDYTMSPPLLAAYNRIANDVLQWLEKTGFLQRDYSGWYRITGTIPDDELPPEGGYKEKTHGQRRGKTYRKRR